MKPNFFACVGAKLDDVALGRRIAAKKITYGQYIKFILFGVCLHKLRTGTSE